MKKMTIAIAATLAFLSTGVATTSFAQNATTNKDAAATTNKDAAATMALIKKNFKASFPQVVIEKITPFRAGLWEVYGGPGIVYTDSTGSLLIQGTVIEVATKKNLTEERLNVLQKFDWKLMDKSKAIKVVLGNGKREMAVFADPSCGFCKKFEADLPKLENVTIYTFLVDVLGAKSTERARNIWCAGDNEKRADVWKKQMVDSVEAETKECADVATKANMDVGRKAGVRGTPTTFFPDGSRLVGALPIEQFAEALNKQK